MANTARKILLFLAGMVIFGLGAAYFAGVFDPAVERQPEEAAARHEAAPAAPAESTAKTARPLAESGDAQPAGEEAETASSEAQETVEEAQGAGTQPEVVVPAFDLLRVEPDGSMVVAGRAAPGAQVEILRGSSVLATTQAGPHGDFAAVLDRALKPGEHNIVLRSTNQENLAATSVETAIVSIPSGKSGDVVALVQQPGEPSRLITVPPARQPQGGDASRKSPAADAGQGARGTQEALPQGESDTMAGEDAGRGHADDSGKQAAGESAPAAPRQQAGAGGTGEENAQDDASPTSDASGTAGAMAEARDEPAAARSEGAGAAGGQPPSVASEERRTRDAGRVPGNAASPFIEAVEIDGREVFVAGRAEPGRRVRVYANDILLGQATVSSQGRFLVETERDLPVGDYIIRADVLDRSGKVIARAAVPFQRPAGEQVAAVAPDQRGEASSADNARAQSVPTDARQEDGERQPSGEDGGVAESAAAAREDGNAAASGDITLPDLGDTALAPALEPAEGAVIIRRGDTLWHISRRVYGRGIRYTTIYLANQDQIRDPDLIWPGQIFTLPGETREGERADFGALGERVVPPEAVTRGAE